MSGTGDDRWRTARGQQSIAQNRQQPHQPQPPPPPPPQQQQQQQQQQRLAVSRDGASTPQSQGRQGSGSQGLATFSGNSWVGNDRGGRGGSSSAMPEEQHTPVRGFNSREARDLLKRDTRPTMYKPLGADTNSAKSTGPWASKPNTTAGGQDFFLQLRKQVTALQQGNTTNNV
ncbi:MAG: hypothetical protein M1827_000881 [Pycnora praestabilis]|nr:MAG: hypothetical protein M1827_000881 [Pycnora praestabilis]